MTRYHFQAHGSSSYTFEEFLRDAEATGIADPGTAMVDVLRRHRISGLDLNRILNSRQLNPCGAPDNLIAFLRTICAEGQWGVNLAVNID